MNGANYWKNGRNYIHLKWRGSFLVDHPNVFLIMLNVIYLLLERFQFLCAFWISNAGKNDFILDLLQCCQFLNATLDLFQRVGGRTFTFEGLVNSDNQANYPWLNFMFCVRNQSWIWLRMLKLPKIVLPESWKIEKASKSIFFCLNQNDLWLCWACICTSCISIY